MKHEQETILIASPLEREHVDRIRYQIPTNVEIIYDPENLPLPRYTADHKGPDDYSRSPSSKRKWREAIAEATIFWDFPPDLFQDRGALRLAPNMKWVQTTSSGVGQMLSSLGLSDSDIIVTTARGVHAVPLAEFVMTSLLAHTKRLRHLQIEQQSHRWVRYCGDDLAGRTMTVIGAGQVGAEVGRLARAFGMTVLAVVNRPSPDRKQALHADQVFGPSQLEEAVSRADCIALCTPHTPQTERMIDASIIAKMKNGVVFINIARGKVVDQSALISALQAGHIGFAALDVTDPEPLPADSPLWDLKNVLISPHSASTTSSENGKITEIFLTNIRPYLAGEPDMMVNLLDKKRMY